MGGGGGLTANDHCKGESAGGVCVPLPREVWKLTTNRPDCVIYMKAFHGILELPEIC